MAKAPSAESILATRTGAAVMTFAAWLERTPAAKDFVLKWAEMRRAGETDWSYRKLMTYLRKTYKAPFSAESVIHKWIAENGGVR